jgi:2-methylaconitate cis-trans-isomerase PrpF
VFHARDLPFDRSKWDRVFLAAMGSPDAYGRQLDGMGGGISSVSKVCVIAPSVQQGADVDYTFGQVLIKEPRVDYSGNCGNMLSAVGPFSVDEGLVQAVGDQALVRIFNTNTSKIIHSVFPIEGGQTRYHGAFSIPGVGGTGAPIRLDFIEPGGATTGKLLPTGQTRETLQGPEFGELEASMVDAGNACVFIKAASIGLTGTELPEVIEGDPRILEILQAIRAAASIRMGISKDADSARAISAVPYVGFVSAPADAPTISGEVISANRLDLAVRIISNGQPHRALPLTASLCTAVAAQIRGTVVQDMLRRDSVGKESLHLGMPSGVLTVGAEVAQSGSNWVARRGSFYRTARRLFDGRVYLPTCPRCVQS